VAGLGDGDGLGFRGHGDVGLERIAARVDDGAVLVELERAGPGVEVAAVDVELEEALALDGHVEGVAGILHVALGEELVHRRRLDAHADLHAGGQPVAAHGLGTGHLEGLVHEVLELGPAFLEAHGVHVGQIVGHGVDLQLHGHHAGGRRPEGSHHGERSPSRGCPSASYLSVPVRMALVSSSLELLMIF